MSPVKKILAAAATVSVVVLVAASAAWACSPMPGGVTLSRVSGAPGTLVEVSGEGFKARAGWPLLEVRWNSSGGRLLGVVDSPSFTTGFYVPEETPSMKSLVVVQRRPTGGIEGKVTVPFEVTAPPPAPPAPPAPEPATPMVPEVPVLAPAPGPRGAPSAASAPVPPAATQGAPTSPAGTPVVPGAVLEPSPAVAPAGATSLLPSAAGASASVAGPKVEVSTPEKTVLVDVRDLWSAVDPGDPSAASTSLMAPSDTRSAAGSPLGAGLLLAGVGLLAGLGLMGLTRRRAVVSR